MISLRELLAAATGAKIGDIAWSEVQSVRSGADREEVATVIANYDLVAVPVVSESGHMLGVITVDDVIDAIQEEQTEDVQKFGGLEALDEPYMQIGLLAMIKKRAGWLSVLLISEMLTTTAMQHFDVELQRVAMLALFVPLVMSSGGNSGSQATSLVTRAMALREIELRDWWRVALRELPAGLSLGAILGVIGVVRISAWQYLKTNYPSSPIGYNYGLHWPTHRRDRRTLARRHRDVRLPRRFDASVRPETPGVRPRQRVRAIRRDARRRHGAQHLFPCRADRPARHALVDQAPPDGAVPTACRTKAMADVLHSVAGVVDRAFRADSAPARTMEEPCVVRFVASARVQSPRLSPRS